MGRRTPAPGASCRRWPRRERLSRHCRSRRCLPLHHSISAAFGVPASIGEIMNCKSTSACSTQYLQMWEAPPGAPLGASQHAVRRCCARCCRRLARTAPSPGAALLSSHQPPPFVDGRCTAAAPPAAGRSALAASATISRTMSSCAHACCSVNGMQRRVSARLPGRQAACQDTLALLGRLQASWGGTHAPCSARPTIRQPRTVLLLL